MTARQPQPHSRWKLRDSTDRLAHSYDAAATAIDAFMRASEGYDPYAPRPNAAARIRDAARQVGSRRWARLLWLTAILLMAGFLLAWISRAILLEFMPGPVPAAAAVAPGLLLALSVGCTALLAGAPAASAARSRRYTQSQPTALASPARSIAVGWPFLVSLAGCAVWVTVWLAEVVIIPVWSAATTGIVSSAVTGAALLTASRPLTSRPSTGPARTAGPAAPPRRLLARQQTAQKRLRAHTGLWSSAAQACGLAFSGSAGAVEALNHLLATGELGAIPGEEMDAFHTQLLVTLRQHQPGPLGDRLGVASARLTPPAHQLLPADRSTR